MPSPSGSAAGTAPTWTYPAASATCREARLPAAQRIWIERASRDRSAYSLTSRTASVTSPAAAGVRMGPVADLAAPGVVGVALQTDRAEAASVVRVGDAPGQPVRCRCQLAGALEIAQRVPERVRPRQRDQPVLRAYVGAGLHDPPRSRSPNGRSTTRSPASTGGSSQPSDPRGSSAVMVASQPSSSSPRWLSNWRTRAVEAEPGRRRDPAGAPVADHGPPAQQPQSADVEGVVADQPQGRAHHPAAPGRRMQPEPHLGNPSASSRRSIEPAKRPAPVVELDRPAQSVAASASRRPPAGGTPGRRPGRTAWAPWCSRIDSGSVATARRSPADPPRRGPAAGPGRPSRPAPAPARERRLGHDAIQVAGRRRGQPNSAAAERRSRIERDSLLLTGEYPMNPDR